MAHSQAEHEKMMAQVAAAAGAQADSDIGGPQQSYGPSAPSYGTPAAPSYAAPAAPAYAAPAASSYAAQAPASSYGSASSSSYGAPAPAVAPYSPPSYAAKPSYGSVAAGPASLYTYPSPSPPVQCPTNLLFSCQPSVAPVPCQSVSYSAAAPKPAYSAPSSSYSAPVPAVSPSYREAANDLPVQPEQLTSTLDDMNKQSDWN